MKRMKVGVILLALLLAAMVPMAMASANESQTTTEIADKDIQEIFDSASNLETLPSFISPQEESAYLEQYISPVRKAIDLMRSKHYTEDQISTMLKKNGYGWDPSTGACWKGRDPTPDEEKMIEMIRGPGYSPFPKHTTSSILSSDAIMTWRQKNAGMDLVDTNTYFGINYDMSPGDMVVTSSGTTQHVATVHVGKKRPNGQDDWTEAGVARFASGDSIRKYFTFDNDEGEWEFYDAAGSTTSTTYKIYVTNTYESGGYLYHTWIGGTWVRDGHLYYRQTQYNCANEIWADGSNPFSQDTISTVFQNEYLYNSLGYQYWGNYPATSTSFSHDNPPYENHSMSGNAWRFVTWT